MSLFGNGPSKERPATVNFSWHKMCQCFSKLVIPTHITIYLEAKWWYFTFDSGDTKDGVVGDNCLVYYLQLICDAFSSTLAAVHCMF